MEALGKQIRVLNHKTHSISGAPGVLRQAQGALCCLSAAAAKPGSSDDVPAAWVGQWQLFSIFSTFQLKDVYWFCVSCGFLFFCLYLFFFFNWLDKKVHRAGTTEGKLVASLSGSWEAEILPACRQIHKDLNLSTLIWSCKQDLNAA